MANLNRPIKFHIGELVKVNGYSKVGVVNQNSGVRSCWIKFYDMKSPIECDEDKVRKLTFGEFIWYRDPNTNNWKIGKNKAQSILLTLAMSFLFIIASFKVEGLLKLVPITISIGIIIINYLGVRNNWTGKWV